MKINENKDSQNDETDMTFRKTERKAANWLTGQKKKRESKTESETESERQKNKYPLRIMGIFEGSEGSQNEDELEK